MNNHVETNEHPTPRGLCARTRRRFFSVCFILISNRYNCYNFGGSLSHRAVCVCVIMRAGMNQRCVRCASFACGARACVKNPMDINHTRAQSEPPPPPTQHTDPISVWAARGEITKGNISTRDEKSARASDAVLTNTNQITTSHHQHHPQSSLTQLWITLHNRSRWWKCAKRSDAITSNNTRNHWNASRQPQPLYTHIDRSYFTHHHNHTQPYFTVHSIWRCT